MVYPGGGWGLLLLFLKSMIFHVPNDVLTEVALIESYLINQIAKSYGAHARPNTLKSPLNWLKFTKKSCGQAPKTPGAPLLFRSWIRHWGIYAYNDQCWFNVGPASQTVGRY